MSVIENAIIERICALCEIPSVSGNEGKVAKRAAGLLEQDGLSVELQEVEPGRSNVIARLKTGREGSRLLFNGHLDTLPPPAEGWTRDPYRPAIENGRLYAAEVNNMKGAVGGMMWAMAELQRRSADLCGEIILSAVVGECDSLGLGTVSALERGLTADFCINGEPTDLAVMTSHAGVTQLKLTVHGHPAHVSQRAQGIDAISGLVALLRHIREDALTYTAHPDFPGLPTIHVGVIAGGILPSMLAPSAEARIDVRTVPGMTPQSVLGDLQRLIEEAKKQDAKLKAEVVLSKRPTFMQPHPFHMATDAPIVTAVAKAHLAVSAKPAHVGTLVPQVFFGSDASHILAAGIPTAIYGPGQVSDISTANESIAVADVVTAAQTYLASALSLCAKGRPS
ncbi:M20 family metallopeptidase [Taklimakanibacter deserti]|uniref:M20 family metallopeptidase n=1 Tax=Taklimakanibacter deserti TaxID=2267839 RepID=UPI0013C496F1